MAIFMDSMIIIEKKHFYFQLFLNNEKLPLKDQ